MDTQVPLPQSTACRSPKAVFLLQHEGRHQAKSMVWTYFAQEVWGEFGSNQLPNYDVFLDVIIFTPTLETFTVVTNAQANSVQVSNKSYEAARLKAWLQLIWTRSHWCSCWSQLMSYFFVTSFENNPSRFVTLLHFCDLRHAQTTYNDAKVRILSTPFLRCSFWLGKADRQVLKIGAH